MLVRTVNKVLQACSMALGSTLPISTCIQQAWFLIARRPLVLKCWLPASVKMISYFIFHLLSFMFHLLCYIILYFYCVLCSFAQFSILAEARLTPQRSEA